jgi:hypothetical protein
MAFASIAGFDVLAARLTVPRAGCWHADLTVDADADAKGLTGRLTLTLGDGASTWSGAVVRGGDAFGRRELRIVGGAGGLATVLPGQSYRQTTAGQLLEDVLGGAGEQLAGSIDPGLLATPFDTWSRIAAPAAHQLAAIVGALGVSWRVLPSGLVWLGADTWPAAPAALEADVLEVDARLGRWVLGTSNGYLLQPGQTYAGQRLDLVEHFVTADSLRTNLWLA